MAQVIIKIFFTFFTGFVILSQNPFAHAQSGNELKLGERAIITASKLEDAAIKSRDLSSEKGISDTNQAQNHENMDLRRRILNGFDSSGDAGFLEAISVYKTSSIEQGLVTHIELAGFYEDLSEIYNPYSAGVDTRIQDTLSYLGSELNNPNWLISYNATIISSVLNSYQRNFPVALELASESFNKIPSEDNFDTQLSRYYSYATTAYLHGVLKNADRYISSLDILVSYSLKIGVEIGVANDLNNLIYSLKEVNINPDITRQLVDILLRVGESHPSDTLGLVEMRAANALIRIGDFERALPIAQKGLAASENDMISNYLKIAEIQSLAATGNDALAEIELAAFKIKLAKAETDTSFADSEIFKAQGLIARAHGDAEAAFTNMNRHAELSTQRLLRSNNSDTSNLLANLENDKARQAEREAAREDMFRLEEEALKQRIASTQRGFMIVLMLAIAAILTAAFMTYRSRTAIKLAQSAEAALAGEKAKTQFLAVISHELRTPLNGIIGIADLLSRTAPTDDLRRKISIINNSGLDLLKLVEQILDMSRIDANELQVFPESANIREVIAGVDMLWRTTIEEKNVTFTSHVDPSVPEQLTFDPMRLRQCVNNLVSNASKFTKQGRIHLHVTVVPADTRDEVTVNIIVADTGLGIRPEVQGKLFQPFIQADSSITRQYGGSGLGLAISRSLARIMGGDLVVTSREGAGSEFTLTLTARRIQDTGLLDKMDELFADIEPGQNAAINSAALASLNTLSPTVTATIENTAHRDSDVIPPEAQDAADINIEAAVVHTADPNLDTLNGVRVLIVEDVLSNQDVLKIFLEPEGCEIMCANNGLEALSALQSQSFDVVLMDIRMPGMDGIEATRLIRSEKSRNSHIPIIALTADATAETNAQSMAAGANIFLTKPIIATELFNSIRFVRRQVFNRAEMRRAEKISEKTVSKLSA